MAEPADKLPVGTSPTYTRIHTTVRRVCYVLLFALVVEGALTFPVLAAWYGFPTLSLTEICTEMQKHRYSDASRECKQPYDFPGPPITGRSEAEGQTTAQDTLGVQPKPRYRPIGYRELVDHHEACEQFEGSKQKPPFADPGQQRRWNYCSYLSETR